ncbi:MAG: VWA domain-containing protein [Planctomycetaceae bacterium]|nr:VWA domain-containing protein [Planctomycetaceae bacterium]
MGLSFTAPHLLLFLLLLPLVWRTAGKGRRLTAGLRVILVGVAILALARPSWERASRGSDLIVLVDRSASCETTTEASLREILPLLRQSQSSGDRTAVIGFGAGARLEQGFAGTAGPTQPEGFSRSSDLSAGLDLAASLRDPRRRTAVLSLGDGLATDGKSLSIAASRLGMPFFFRVVGGMRGGDVAAGDVLTPGRVQPRSAWPVRFAVTAERAGEAGIKVSRDGAIVFEKTVDLRRGLNSFTLLDVAPDRDAVRYRLDVHSDNDPVLQNNRGLGLVLIDRPPRVLLVTERDRHGWLEGALEAGMLPVDRVRPRSFPDTPALLAPYAAVVLEDCRLGDFAPGGVRSLTAMVKAGLVSLLATGGPNSFGAGGYHRSELDPLLPVEMELQNDTRRGGVALAIALDRSGSMGVSAGGGVVKMDLANQGAAEAIRLLSEWDQVSVIAVDSEAHIVVPLAQADAPEELASLTLGITPMGGGIFCRTAIVAAAEQVRRSNLRQRHIILFADASDAEEQEGCLELVRDLQDEGIGVSVVAMGREDDSDAVFLRQVAAFGGGVAAFANDAAGLPALFTGEVIRLAQRGFIKEPVAPRALSPMASLVLDVSELPGLGGYNVSAAREGATVFMRLDDEFNTPVAALRSVGNSSVAALLFQVEGEFAGGFTRWAGAAEMVVSLLRRIAPGQPPDGVKVYSSKGAASGVVEVELSPETARRLRDDNPVVRWLGPGGKTIETPLVWQGPLELTATLPLDTPGHYLPVADLGGRGVAGPPLTLSSSPEYRLARPGEGRRTLAGIAALAVGGEVVDVSRVRAMATAREQGTRDLSGILVWCCIFLFLLELAGRRLDLFN